MTEIVELSRVRISPALINEISDAYPLDVRLTKIVAPDLVMFKGRDFSSIEVAASNFKCGLTFIDCRFSGSVFFREIKSGGPISFINCAFGSDFTMFSTVAAPSISLIRCRVKGRLFLEGVSTPKLDVQSVSAVEFSVVAHEVAARIEFLSLENISTSGAVRVDSTAGLQRLALNDCSARVLVIRQVGIQTNSLLSIQSSRVDEIIFDDIKIDGAEIRITSTLGENLYLRNCSLEHSKVIFEQVLVNRLFAIKQCNYLGAAINISEVTCPNIELDESLFDFISLGGKKEATIFSPSFSDESRLRTLKLLKDKFAREHRYDLEDNVFYLLKNFEARLRIRSCSWWKIPVLYAAYFLSRYIVGWGVRLRNPLVCVTLIIGVCAFIYYLAIGLYDSDKSIQYLGQTVSGFYGAITISLLAFFGQHADVKIIGNIPIAMALGEFILGMTMTTIIVGMLIRKLVR